jgi:hypothetical protein
MLLSNTQNLRETKFALSAATIEFKPDEVDDVEDKI